MVRGRRSARQEASPGCEVQAGHTLQSQRSGGPGRVKGQLLR